MVETEKQVPEFFSQEQNVFLPSSPLCGLRR